MFDRLKEWAAHMARDVVALSIAMGDNRVPWYAKAVAFFVLAYALSPIDLIPDFIPVLGYLDDLLLLPVGIWVVLNLIPDDLMEEIRKEAEGITEKQLPKNILGAVLIGILWGVILYAVVVAFTADKAVEIPIA